jgi:hypothetical protein
VKKIQNQLSSLLDKFTQGVSKSQQTQIKTLLGLICTILVKETVNLNKLKSQFGIIVQKELTHSDSHYRRLTRFFDTNFCLRQLWKSLVKVLIERLILNLDQVSADRLLLLDSTSWAFGRLKVHLLTLSIVYQGISIPLFLYQLTKKGDI